MHKFFIYLTVSVIFSAHICIFNSLYGAEPGQRPKVGVVLSGGGAKGFAHIAVLRTLEELNIPVDYIGGTSMGSTVAALYAMGYSVDELEAIARNTDWLKYFKNGSDRKDENLIYKLFFQEYPFMMDISGNGISFPRGFVNGQRTGLLLSRFTWDYQHVKNFSELPIPFLCVATDYEKGEGTILEKGNLAESLRASMAIPSVFEPVIIDGRIYLDGGVVNNFPVKEIKDKGADIVIGVDVSSRLYKKNELDSLQKIMEQSISFLGEKKTLEQREICDILITPDIKDLNSMDFDRTDEIIKRGGNATKLQMEKLKKLSEMMQKYKIEKKTDYSQDRNRGITVDAVSLHGLVKVSKSIIKQSLDISPGDTVTADKIEKSINAIYGMNSFTRISYNIERIDNKNILHVYFTERGENHLYFGITYDSEVNAGMLIGLEIENVGFKNTAAIIKGRLGNYNSLDADYLIYTPIDPGIWIDADAGVYKIDFNVFESGSKIAVYKFTQQTSSVSLNTYYSNWIILSGGVRKEFYFIDGEIVDLSSTGRYRFDAAAFYGSLKIDSLDDFNFPTAGFYFEAQIDYVRTDRSYFSNFSLADKFERNMVNTNFAIPLGKKLSFQSGFSASSVSQNEAPPSYWFVMGGYQKYRNWIYPLNGYEMMEKIAQHGWVYSLALQYEFIPDFFLTGKWNEGKTVDRYSELFKYSDTDAGFGIIAGYKSPLGPLTAGIFKKARSRDYTVHFNIGFIF